MNDKRMLTVRKKIRTIKVLRSTELMTIAFERGLLDCYVVNNCFIQHPKKEVLEGVLWGLKLNGCGISEGEINQIIKLQNL